MNVATILKIMNPPETSKRITVLHLIYSPGFGGIESIVINWWRTFDRARFDVHVAYFAGDRNREQPFVDAARAVGMPLIPVPWNRFKPFLACARAVAQAAREREVDIIHTHAYYGDAVGAIAGKLARVKTVATVYVWGKYELHRQLMQLMDWTAIQFMTRVTAHCRDTANKTFVLGTQRKDIQILLPGYPDRHTAYSKEKRLAARRAAGVKDDEILLVNAARLAPEKAQDQLIQSFRVIHDRYPQTRLWISGVGMDSVKQNLETLRQELRLQNAVELRGFSGDFWSLLSVADMMVHPSHVEGIPQSIMGGMAAGLPIVASDVGGVSEVIHHGHTGLLVKENAVSGFAQSVIDLISQPQRMRELGENARNAIETELSTEAAVRKVEELYRQMVS